MRLLIVHTRRGSPSAYMDDWIDAFERRADLRCTCIDAGRIGSTAAIAREAALADAVVLLHGVMADTMDHAERLAGPLKDRRGPLIVVMGNEYNTPWSPIGPRIDWLSEVGAEFVGTQLPLASARWLYATIGATVVETPHALNPRAYSPVRPRARRRYHIGTRSFRYPIYVGDDRRNTLHRAGRAFAARHGLDCSIEDDLRLDRSRWARFLNDCRFTLATEAGAVRVERDDRTALRMAELVARGRGTIRANGRLRPLLRFLPFPVKDVLRKIVRPLGIEHEALRTMDDVAEAAFALVPDNSDGNGVDGRCVSARHFDAIGTRTVQILARGRYNGLLQPGEHYIETDATMSNDAEVAEAIRDDARCERIADRALAHALAHHTVDHRVADVVETLGGV